MNHNDDRNKHRQACEVHDEAANLKTISIDGFQRHYLAGITRIASA
ncbi:hypothetical protein RMSM_07259 [Rhodopirellula maiorica SM1]|uniref:Uncharacterized protein n=1 Tax=Rhodopirellula maiorica SM1 TaxID=1265738 RepID=M5R8L8_9BACT|nr:hypothetical protein RMSM_07259 [Rhodopirellula maiorica SM1]